MAGGTWVTQNKVRPGAYINVNSVGTTPVPESDIGIMTMAIPLDFGPENQIIEIDAKADLTFLGYELKNTKLLLLKEALKRAKTVLLYRIGSGEKAKAVEETITVTALYGGTRGNAISITSKANVNISGAFDVETYLEGNLIDRQTGKTVSDLRANKLVTFSGEGNLKAFKVALTGGTNTQGTVADYMNYFEKVQVFDFNTMALPVSDSAIKTAGAAFIKRMRDDEGKKCQLVVADMDADSEAVISVKNGVVLSDGTVIDAAKATAWVAAASAAAGVATSLTYAAYDDAVDVDQRFTNTEIISALEHGEFLFIEKRGEAVIEQDINTLRTFTAEKGKDFAKNRVLRTLDDIANSTKKSFEDNYIGKVNNDQDGREMFKADRISYFDSLQGAGAITNFESDDVEVVAGNERDSILMNVAVQPVDAMEKLYATVKVL